MATQTVLKLSGTVTFRWYAGGKLERTSEVRGEDLTGEMLDRAQAWEARNPDRAVRVWREGWRAGNLKWFRGWLKRKGVLA